MRDLIRTQVLSLVHAPWALAYPTTPIVYDNQAFDWNDLPERFVVLEIKLYDGRQIGASSTPKTRYSGYVYVSVQAREGLGARVCGAMADWFSNALKYQNVGPVRLQAPEPAGSDTVKGYYFEDIKVAFYADEV